MACSTTPVVMSDVPIAKVHFYKKNNNESSAHGKNIHVIMRAVSMATAHVPL